VVQHRHPRTIARNRRLPGGLSHLDRSPSTSPGDCSWRRASSTASITRCRRRRTGHPAPRRTRAERLGETPSLPRAHAPQIEASSPARREPHSRNALPTG
jgi:hypothetical protein